MTVKEMQNMDYSSFVGLIRERNRPSGGIKTVHEVAKNARIGSQSTMLEIGSNTGFTSVNMALLTGSTVTGIDPNEASVTEATKYAGDQGAENVAFKVASALDLPFDGNTFDAVWCSNVTSFIDNKDKAISEYLRVLKPGGVLIVVPIYYVDEPPKKVVDEVSTAINAKIDVWDKAYWDELFQSVSSADGHNIEKFFEADYRYNDRGLEILPYVDNLMSKPHLRELDNEVLEAAKERCTYFMTLFNQNLQYAGYSIMLYQKRNIKDEVEFFLTEQVS